MKENEAFPALARRFMDARQKQPGWKGRGKWWALAAIEQAARGFHQAVCEGSEADQEDAALDVAAACLRFIMEEHKGD